MAKSRFFEKKIEDDRKRLVNDPRRQELIKKALAEKEERENMFIELYQDIANVEGLFLEGLFLEGLFEGAEDALTAT